MVEWIDGYILLIGLMVYLICYLMFLIMYNNVFVKLGLNYVYLVFEVMNEMLLSVIELIRIFDMCGFNILMLNK